MSAVFPAEELSTLLTDFAPDPLIVIGQGFKVLYANPAARALRQIHGRNYNQDEEDRNIRELINWDQEQVQERSPNDESSPPCGAEPGAAPALKTQQKPKEGLLTISVAGNDVGLEFTVHKHPVQWMGESAVLIALNDVTHENRRKVLERLFFHDILNTAGSVKGLSEILLMDRQEMGMDEQAELLAMMRDSCGILVDEIRSQQTLLAAESGQLSTDWKQIAISDCLTEAAMVGSHWQVASTKRLVPVYPAGATMFTTDPALLGRVLINLLKNALEATPAGKEVRLAGRERGDAIEFSVWNIGTIPEATRSQIFERSFSTKGVGRGTGLHSVRLVTERFLQGKVSFTSSEQDGTTFTVVLPLKPPTQLPRAA